jgi:hypothetical protein
MPENGMKGKPRKNGAFFFLVCSGELWPEIEPPVVGKDVTRNACYRQGGCTTVLVQRSGVRIIQKDLVPRQGHCFDFSSDAACLSI